MNFVIYILADHVIIIKYSFRSNRLMAAYKQTANPEETRLTEGSRRDHKIILRLGKGGLELFLRCALNAGQCTCISKDNVGQHNSKVTK